MGDILSYILLYNCHIYQHISTILVPTTLTIIIIIYIHVFKIFFLFYPICYIRPLSRIVENYNTFKKYSSVLLPLRPCSSEAWPEECTCLNKLDWMSSQPLNVQTRSTKGETLKRSGERPDLSCQTVSTQRGLLCTLPGDSLTLVWRPSQQNSPPKKGPMVVFKG